MGIHRITDTTGEPANWKMRHFANMDIREEFFVQLVDEMQELIDITMILGEEREKIREAILIVTFEGLMPAFETLKKIRA